jgi:peptidoglycan/LPS O-acetylase OafA/YrhL
VIHTHQTITYRPDIQGLRAVAVVLVVLAHGQVPGFQGGFVGVDVFFVLSGYLITGLLICEHRSNGNINLSGFYAQRLKRLLPALAVMLCMVILLVPWVLSLHEAAEQTTSLPYAATWTSNLYFALTEVDYFAELRTRDLFLHTWSLGLEEQFYLFWPILLLGALATPIRNLGRIDNRRLVAIFASLFTCSLGLSFFLTESHAMIAYYLLPSRIWQFTLGASVLIWLQIKDQTFKTVPVHHSFLKWSARLPFAGLVLIVGSSMLIDNHTPYPGIVALIPSVGAAMIILTGQINSASIVVHILKSPVLVWIGNRSYSWYLWHWPVYMIGFAWGMQAHIWLTLTLAIFSLMLATISYKYIELPFWKGRLSKISTRRVFLLSLLTMLSLIALSVKYLGSFDRTVSSAKSETTVSAYNPRNDLPVIYSLNCDSAFLNSDIHPCIIGQQHAPKTVVLIGDSIGAQWTSLLSGIFHGPEWRSVVFTKSSCPMVDEDVLRGNGQVFKLCNEWRNKVLDYLPSLRPDVVFIGNGLTYGFSKIQWIAGSSRVLERLSAVTNQVVVIIGTPKLSFDGPGCLERQINRAVEIKGIVTSNCQETLTSTLDKDVASYLDEAVKQFTNARIVNLNNLVCPDRVCSAKSQDGQVVFRDSQHLTDSFVKAQIPTVAKLLGNLID